MKIILMAVAIFFLSGALLLPKVLNGFLLPEMLSTGLPFLIMILSMLIQLEAARKRVWEKPSQMVSPKK